MLHIKIRLSTWLRRNQPMAVNTETPNDTKSTDRIEKRVVLRAPRTRVWRALTNAEEFGTWFRVKLEGAFTEGRPVRGRLSIPGYEPTTLVEFTLEETEGGTALTIVESGFDRIPLGRRAEAFRMNDNGWTGQIKQLAKYVE